MKTIIVRTINWMYFVIENILYRFLFQKRPLYIKESLFAKDAETV